MESIVYTPKEVATLLRIRLATVYELIKSGDIPSIRIGRNYKIPKKAFDAWLVEKTERRKPDGEGQTAELRSHCER